MSRSMQELCWASRCASVAGRMWGVDHRWILDRHLHVLHADGTNATGWILVWVPVCKWSENPINWTRINLVLMNGIGALNEMYNWHRCLSPRILAQIVAGFISFGVLHTHTKGFEPWQWSDFPYLLPPALSDRSQAHDHHWYDDSDPCHLILVSL